MACLDRSCFSTRSTRALRNAGMGVGALAATLTVAGADLMRVPAAVTAVAYVVSAMTALTIKLGPSAAPTALPPPALGGRRLGPADKAMRALYAGNLPYALCFDVLEIALPAVLVNPAAGVVLPGIPRREHRPRGMGGTTDLLGGCYLHGRGDQVRPAQARHWSQPPHRRGSSAAT